MKKNIIVNKKIVVANWKTNPKNYNDAKKIFLDLKKSNLKLKNTLCVLCPPTIFIREMIEKYSGSRFSFGVQDVSVKNDDESTGDVSPEILKNIGIKFSIVGHSERRKNGESDQVVSLKLKNSIESKIIPILCIGEIERDNSGKYLRFIEQQIRDSLSLLSMLEVRKILIAYEPVWAIGKGHNAISGHELHQINLYIKKILSDIYDRKTAMSIPILYGGSIDAENCKELICEGEVDGFLVGRSSLNPFVFNDILKVVESI
ncbi:MAG TPA: triose-phosphate isomerase [Candidatus Paceibacterota bacterium]|nr:triose-phosphate isomerase [Candidatus Paceibacterota bacterium]HMP19042.1 triose-phosphate isomerase [Candidatus Paceibacterota bacterium]HMP85193.1 triose-phosphate isomerase [Candidatus Paceibacterota bacterium]